MLTGLICTQVDQTWNAFWSGGVADITPTDVDRLLTKIALGRPRPSKTPPKPSTGPH